VLIFQRGAQTKDTPVATIRFSGSLVEVTCSDPDLKYRLEAYFSLPIPVLGVDPTGADTLRELSAGSSEYVQARLISLHTLGLHGVLEPMAGTTPG
jgi:hypothetical protein